MFSSCLIRSFVSFAHFVALTALLNEASEKRPTKNVVFPKPRISRASLWGYLY